MDVTGILAVEPSAAFTVALWLIGIFAALTVLSLVVDRYRDLPGWVPVAGLILTVVAIFTAGISSESAGAERQNMLESALFETYGITASSHGARWDGIVGAGDSGAMAKVTIDESDVSVLFKLDGTRLTIIDADGQELPANPGR